MSGNPNRTYSSPSAPVDIDGSQGGLGGVAAPDTCAKAYRGARLSSPKLDVLSRLQVEDRLNLEVRAYKDRFVLVAVTKSGKDAGTIMSSSTIQIIKCIQDGHRYIAIVKTLNGGDCTLEIRMKE